MNHLFIPYELALTAKEKGFNEPCIKLYSQDKTIHPVKFKTGSIKNDYYKKYLKQNPSHIECTKICAAPLYQQIIEWFRNTYFVFIETYPMYEGYGQAFHYKHMKITISTHRNLNKLILDNIHIIDYQTSMNKALEEAFKAIEGISNLPYNEEIIT